jgi:hypothetical protein
MQGIETYKTKESFTVVKVHYTADPDKRTEEAIAELAKGYPGGRGGAAWRKEMEIDFTAYSGQLLCYHILQQYRHKIIVDKFIPSYWLKFGSLDWGRNNPASFHVYAVSDVGHIHSSYEIYMNNTSIPDFSNLIKECKYYSELPPIIADPSLFNKNQEEEKDAESIADKFRKNGINLVPAASRNDQLAINELLDRWDKLDTQDSRFTISPQCPKQIWEFERLRYKELSTAMLEMKNPHEVLVDKDNHSWDDYKYFISHLLLKPDLISKTTYPPDSPFGRAEAIRKRKEQYAH